MLGTAEKEVRSMWRFIFLLSTMAGLLLWAYILILKDVLLAAFPLLVRYCGATPPLTSLQDWPFQVALLVLIFLALLFLTFAFLQELL
jgi:hypothetical protein